MSTIFIKIEFHIIKSNSNNSYLHSKAVTKNTPKAPKADLHSNIVVNKYITLS